MDYSLPVADERSRRFAAGWLFLGLAALTASGLLALLLVLSRTPGAQDVIPWIDFFHTALVVHVDLSVLIWFVAFSAAIWTLSSAASGGAWRTLALGAAALGTLVVALAPFAGAGSPLMNNYIPVLDHPLFLAGLAIFGFGMALQVIVTLATGLPSRAAGPEGAAMSWASYTGALAAVLALAALAWTFLGMAPGQQGRAHYETLFWGGGHLVQFAYAQVMLLAWLWLASAIGAALPIPGRVTVALILLGFAPALYGPAIYLVYGVNSPAYWAEFTWLMQWGGGVAALPIGLALLAGLAARRGAPLADEQRPLRNALVASLLLYGAGGVLGFLIRGVNTVIPAHYHGSIVGVTLAFMGLSYLLLPKLGYGTPRGRLAASQPYVYAGGQALHIAGLAAAGFMGIQRKAAGAEQGLRSLPEMAAMGVMGIGGVISIIGGFLFLVVALRAIWGRK